MFGHYDKYFYVFIFGVATGGYLYHRAIQAYMRALGRAMPFRSERPSEQFHVPSAR